MRFDNWVSTTCLWLVMRTKFICKTSKKTAKSATAAHDDSEHRTEKVSMCNIFIFASEMKIKCGKSDCCCLLCSESILYHCIEIHSVYAPVYLYMLCIHAFELLDLLAALRTSISKKHFMSNRDVCSYMANRPMFDTRIVHEKYMMFWSWYCAWK